MNNFTSRNGGSSRDHTGTRREKTRFRNSQFDTPRTIEESYPAISSHHGKDHKNRSPYSNSVDFNQEQKGTRIPFYAHNEDTNTYSNPQRHITERISDGNRHQKRHESQIDIYLSGAHRKDMHNHTNHQTGRPLWENSEYYTPPHHRGMHNYNNQQTSWSSRENYRCHSQCGRKTSVSSGAHHEDFRRHSSHQRHATDRMLEGNVREYTQYEMQRVLCAFQEDVGNHNTCGKYVPNQTYDETHPGRPNSWWCSSGNHAPLAPICLPEIYSNAMTHGNNKHPISVMPTHSKVVISTASPVNNVAAVNDVTQHDFLGKGNASRHTTKDEMGESKLDSRDPNCSSSIGTEKNFNERIYDKEAAMHEASECLPCDSDDAVALYQLGQIGAIGPNKSIFRMPKKLLVLDLNGILVDILRVPNAAQIYADREHTNVSRKTAFKRPFCDEFLDFCFSVFDIGIWSSRMKHNVDIVVDYLLGNKKKKLLFCWDGEKCTNTGFKTFDDACKPLVLKELSKLWDKEEPDLPWGKGVYSSSNTLLIDDSPYKALCNPPCTGIFPHPYNFTDEKDDSLGPGGDLRVFLEGLVKADDVQEYVRRNPIGQRCIVDDGSSSWRFYLQVIKRVRKGKKMAV